LKIDLCGLTEGRFGVLPTCYHHATKIGNAPKFCEMLSALTFPNENKPVTWLSLPFLDADFLRRKFGWGSGIRA